MTLSAVPAPRAYGEDCVTRTYRSRVGGDDAIRAIRTGRTAVPAPPPRQVIRDLLAESLPEVDYHATEYRDQVKATMAREEPVAVFRHFTEKHSKILDAKRGQLIADGQPREFVLVERPLEAETVREFRVGNYPSGRWLDEHGMPTYTMDGHMVIGAGFPSPVAGEITITNVDGFITIKLSSDSGNYRHSKERLRIAAERLLDDNVLFHRLELRDPHSDRPFLVITADSL